MDASSPPAAPADPAAAPVRRALLIDDEPVIRLALRRFFQRQGWQVEEAEDGTRALTLLLGDAAGTAFDVIVCDLRMPGISGEELYGRIAAARPALLRRIIVSTGDSVSPEASDFLRRTGVAVLNKPFELAELRALVERVTAVA